MYEPDRPSKNQMRLSPWYPEAEIVNPQMRTRGPYRTGWPRGGVVHFTAGRDNALNAIHWGRVQGFAYLCIQGGGQIFQAHPIDHWGYHAGVSSHPRLGGNVSQYLIGIEVTCAGKLDQLPDGKFQSWFGKTYLEDQVRYVESEHNIKGGWYHKFTDAQEASLIQLIKWLHSQAPDVFDLDLVVGHDEVSPGRKTDPGGSLSVSMPELRQRLKDEIGQSSSPIQP